jgi:hypothetical protein
LLVACKVGFVSDALFAHPVTAITTTIESSLLMRSRY